MSEYEQVIDEIVKHGVTVKVNKIVDDNYIPYERKYVGCVVELDFSEHDKVFEDKIARLEEQIAEMCKLCVKNDIYEIEKAQLCLLRDENKKLKQRIAELESKETGKQKKRTGVIVAKEIDGQTYVALDDFMSVINDLQAEIGT